MRKLSLRRRGTVVAGVVLAGALAVGGATAFAATSPSTSTSTQASVPTAAHKHHGKHPRLRRLHLLGVHGQATVKNAKTGQYVVREWQRGQVTAVSGADVTVKSADGVSWTWAVAQNSKITRDGKKISESVLKDGDTVLVVGKQSGSANDAGRIFAPTAAHPQTGTNA